MKKKMVNWEQLENYVSCLAEKIKENMGEKIPGIYGLPRGGLVPAVMLSHKLNAPLLLAPCEGCVVVDDIADTGTTLKHFADKGFKIAVIWYKPRSSVKPNFYAVKDARSKLGGSWIVFPWETPPTSVK